MTHPLRRQPHRPLRWRAPWSLLGLGILLGATNQGCQKYLTCEEIPACYEAMGGESGSGGKHGSGGDGESSGGTSSGGGTGGGSSGGQNSTGGTHSGGAPDGGTGGSSGATGGLAGENAGGGAGKNTGGTADGGGNASGGGTGGGASCEVSGDCSAAAPVCDEDSSECRACTASDDCSAHDSSTPYCEETSGTCEQCITNDHCTAGKPICDDASFSCRTCEEHAECNSGACGQDGRCINEAKIVYALAGTGALNLPCGTSGNPCRDLQDAVGQVSSDRNTLVLVETEASFTLQEQIVFPPAEGLFLVGNNVEIDATSSGADWATDFTGGSAQLHELNMIGNNHYNSHLIRTSGGVELRISRGSFRRSHFGIDAGTGTKLEVRGASFDGLGGYQIVQAIRLMGTGTISVSGSRFSNYVNAIQITGVEPVELDFTGNLVTRVSQDQGGVLLIDSGNTSVMFNTFAYSGNCGGTPLISVPDTSFLLGNIAYQTMREQGGASCLDQVYATGAAPTYSIAEVHLAGEGNLSTTDPGFIDPQGGDFRLRADSPAINLVPLDKTDIQVDFEGNPRPVGNGYDAGAFERQ